MLKALCIGEILWDIFPDKKVWGGAPANFIFHTSQHGVKSTAYTAVGNDENGREIVREAEKCGINLVAKKVNFPTGVVNISVDSKGVASYEFNQDCAWDHIPFTEELESLCKDADLITFGSLAQRSEISRKTIFEGLKLRKPSCKVLFDVNLRQSFYSKEIILKSLKEADFLKLNEDEIVVFKELLGFDLPDLMERFGLELIIFTLGAEGSQIISKNGTFNCPADKCNIVDTVGAGDSFTATFIIHYLKGVSIPAAQKAATKIAAYVCEHSGATVSIPNELKKLSLEEERS